MKILCSGLLFRHPVGGHTWHHLQYLVCLQRLGHEVAYFEDFGWKESCYDPSRAIMTSDPAYGIAYMTEIFRRTEFTGRWWYLAEDGAARGSSRDELADVCRDCDLYLNLSNINWIPELENCRRRVMVDTDPVFTQINALGMDVPFEKYHALFTYGENVHRPGCEMPTAGARWMPTRQPVLLDAWRATPASADAPWSTVINWTAIEPHWYEGKCYRQKDHEFQPFFDLPKSTGEKMQIAVNAERSIRRRLFDGGWQIADEKKISRDPWTYQDFLRSSRAEFCVAKHGYVVARSGWFSDRSAAYLASGRPVVVQDTGFSEFLPCGKGLMSFKTPDQAAGAMQAVNADLAEHSKAARQLAEEYFDANKVLADLLARCV